MATFQRRIVGYMIERTDSEGNKYCTPAVEGECCAEEGSGGSSGAIEGSSGGPIYAQGWGSCEEAELESEILAMDTQYQTYHPGGLFSQWFAIQIPAIPPGDIRSFYVSIYAENPNRAGALYSGLNCNSKQSVTNFNDVNGYQYPLGRCFDVLGGSTSAYLFYIEMGHPFTPQPAGYYYFKVGDGPCVPI